MALSAHVDVAPEHEGSKNELLHRIEHELAEAFHITHTTIQLECSACAKGPVSYNNSSVFAGLRFGF